MEESLNFEKGKVEVTSELPVLKQEGQVILQGTAKDFKEIQIHECTHLVCYKNHKESKLLFSFGISTFPKFSEGTDQDFTLIFEGLPDDCTEFYYQSVPSGGTWRTYDFTRNVEDIYKLEIE